MSESTTARLGDEKFISQTTFKRNGDAAASPMWIVPQHLFDTARRGCRGGRCRARISIATERHSGAASGCWRRCSSARSCE